MGSGVLLAPHDDQRFDDNSLRRLGMNYVDLYQIQRFEP
jgi:aryl-alcohol dehydrogenase-like predicted oxidoreductase